MVYKYWIPLYLWKSLGFRIIFHCVRCLQLIPATMMFHTVCRTVCLVVVIVHAILGVIESNEKSVKDIHNFWKGPDILLKHKSLEIIFLMWNDYISPIVVIIVLFGSMLSVLFNYISLKLYAVIPMPMYLFFPTFAVLLPCVVLVMLPVGTAVHERDAEVHAKWKYYAHRSSNVKLLSRQLRATKVIRITGGISDFQLFTLNQSFTPRYFSAMVDYTITALLSIPVAF